MDSERRDTLSPTKSSFNLATSPEDAETPVENGQVIRAIQLTDLTTGFFAITVVLKLNGPAGEVSPSRFRTWDNAVATSTNTVASRTRSSSSLLLARP
jgi:hypothetical protein